MYITDENRKMYTIFIYMKSTKNLKPLADPVSPRNFNWEVS